MAESRNGNPVVTVVVLIVVGLAAAGTFIELNHRTSRPEASGAAGVGTDGVANLANRAR